MEEEEKKISIFFSVHVKCKLEITSTTTRKTLQVDDQNTLKRYLFNFLVVPRVRIYRECCEKGKAKASRFNLIKSK